MRNHTVHNSRIVKAKLVPSFLNYFLERDLENAETSAERAQVTAASADRTPEPVTEISR